MIRFANWCDLYPCTNIWSAPDYTINVARYETQSKASAYITKYPNVERRMPQKK